ncbi:immunoglobulin domain-containing protein [Spirosoma pomorum]
MMTLPLPASALLRFFFYLLSISTGYAQTIRYVKFNGGGDGSSWANASPDLQAIINTSSSGDQVWVAAGTFKPGGNNNTDRLVSFSMKDGVAIYGSFVGTETTLSERPASITSAQPSTILSGELGASDNFFDNFNNIFVNNNLSSTAILDGFVITGSYVIANGGGMLNQNSSPTVRNCHFLINRGSSGSKGGGMYNDATSNPTLTNCTFISNTAREGGAIFNQPTSTLTVTRCTFSTNSAFDNGAIVGGTLKITNSTFDNNRAGPGPGGGYGGAINISSNSVITNCLFSANQAIGFGGAVFVSAGNPVLINCTFRGNRATDGAGTRYGIGGAMYIGGIENTPTLINCSFSNNIAKGLDGNYGKDAHGGAIYTRRSIPSLINCSFGLNNAQGQGGAIYNESGTTTLTNNILWGNLPNGISNTSNANTVLTYTDTQDNTSGTGNFSLDPLFVDAAGDNLRLQACSPALDKGNNSVNPTTTDLNNTPRLVRQIDLGPYEFQGTPKALVTITQQPNAYFSIPEGGTLTATVAASGSASSYQWYKDGTPVSGATSATLTVSNLNAGSAGRYYVVVTGSCDSDTSTESVLVVNTGMYTVKAGRWDDASVWSMNRVPISSDVVRIKHLVSIPTGFVAEARRLSYDPGQTSQLGTSSKINLTQ